MSKAGLASSIFFIVLSALLFSGCVEQPNANASPTATPIASVIASPLASPSLPALPSLPASPSLSVSPSARASPSPIAPPNVSPSPGAWNDFAQSEVLLDFLYADWCSHCQKMKPIVSEAERVFPAQRFKARWWNEANRTKDKSAMYVFDFYSRKGLFGGFPTFVIAGGYKRVGEMPRADFFDWVCSFFRGERPSACSQYANTTW